MEARRGEGRVWSWAATDVEAEARRRDAEELVGERLRSIRYFTLDYHRYELHPELIVDGPRALDAESEWNEPTWLYNGFDAMDYGFEVITDSGATFSVTWDPPGEHEGIGLQPVPMVGSCLRSDAAVAIWTLGDRPDHLVRPDSWTPMIGKLVTRVDLHYVPWDLEHGSKWCPHITLHGEQGLVEIVMGDSEDGTLVPSSDNIAVLHPGAPLPAWL